MNCAMKDEYKKSQKVMMCNLYAKSRVDREPTNKFYVSRSEWNQTRFYPYCEGSAYVMTPALAGELYELSRFVRWAPFSTWLEDIYVGMLATYANVTFVSMLPHFSSLVQYDEFSLWRVRRDLFWRTRVLDSWLVSLLRRVFRFDKSASSSFNRNALFFVYVKRTEQDMQSVWDVLNQYN